MTGVIRKAALLVALGLVVATGAMAGIPNADNCTVPAWIDVVGNLGGVPDPFGTYTVVVNDVGGFPVPNSVVTIDFAGATDIRLCTDVAPDGQVNTCNIATVTADGSGVATFIVCGGALNGSGLATGGVCGSVVVRADGYLIGNISAAVYDENGAVSGGAGVTGGDDSAWQSDMGLYGGLAACDPLFKARSDFTHEGEITGADRSYWQTRMGAGSSAEGCTYCP